VRLLYLILVASFPALPAPVRQFPHIKVPMRDGVRLCASIALPQETARFPAILIRTPYNKGPEVGPAYLSFVDRGYAVMIQDVRGRYHSGGVFDPLEQEADDGEDTLSWIARQPWSDGSVGMIGGSYLGIAQWKLAARNPPNLKAIFPVVSGSDDYRDRFYSSGGALKLGHRLMWMSENLRAPTFQRPDFDSFVQHLPLRTADIAATGQSSPMFQKALAHPAYDAYWKSISVRELLDRIRVPVFSVGGWYDNFVESDLEAFARLSKTPGHRTIIGPWPHNMSLRFSGVDFGPDSMVPVRALQHEWFDSWMKASGAVRKDRRAGGGPLRIFVMGVNRWRDEYEWPLARAVATPFYLASSGHANSLDGDGELRPKPGVPARDRYVYDPRNPVPTVGGAVCCNPKIFPWGPIDQRSVERRKDVLVYSSAPLKTDLEVTGPIRVILYASSTAPDTDFTAKLVDVFPDNSARNLTDGILRLRYRYGLDKPARGHAGETYQIEINAGVTSNVFLAGHRVRLEISSSNFPRFDRNPNTGGPIADETELRAASQTIFHGGTQRSHVLLPVVSRR
jgi:putative CocE/NonD family hydrolase